MSRRSISATLLAVVAGSVLAFVQCEMVRAQAPQSTTEPTQAVAPAKPSAAAAERKCITRGFGALANST